MQREWNTADFMRWFGEGVEAYRAGVAYTQCPHIDYDKSLSWRQGWHTAEQNGDTKQKDDGQ